MDRASWGQRILAVKWSAKAFQKWWHLDRDLNGEQEPVPGIRGVFQVEERASARSWGERSLGWACVRDRWQPGYQGGGGRLGGQGRGGRVCDEVRALGSGHLMEVCVYVCGGGQFVCRGWKFGFYSKLYEERLQDLNCRTDICTKPLLRRKQLLGGVPWVPSEQSVPNNSISFIVVFMKARD